MLVGLNTYNSNASKNIRFGASTEAVRLFSELQRYEPSTLYKFTSMEINALARKDRSGAPKVYKELADLAEKANHWAANNLRKIAEAASKW